jgi:hypothetical protein
LLSRSPASEGSSRDKDVFPPWLGGALSNEEATPANYYLDVGGYTDLGN